MSAGRFITSLVKLIWLFTLLSGSALAYSNADTGSAILFAAGNGKAALAPLSVEPAMQAASKAASADFFSQERMVGSFLGLRQGLANAGIDYTLLYRADNFFNLQGGVRKGHGYIFQFDYAASMDMQQLTGWPGATCYIHGITNNGESVKALSGDAQGPSNLEALRITKLYQAWIEQTFMSERFSLRGGLDDLNSEFYVTGGSGLFLNSSFGVGIDLAQTGTAGPSIFPNTSLALRVKAAVTPALTIQAAVLDGAPGLPGQPSANEFSVTSHDGALLIAEAIYSFESASPVGQSTFAFGAWRYTASFEDVAALGDDGNPLVRTDNAGFYATASHQIFSPSAGSTECLTAFVRFGMANGNINPYRSNLACGLVSNGLIPGRESDVCGIAWTRAESSMSFRAAAEANGNPFPGTESTLEMTYRLSAASWCAVQLDVQHIFTRETTVRHADTTVAGMRMELQF